jgi:pilus assembly protein CpaB
MKLFKNPFKRNAVAKTVGLRNVLARHWIFLAGLALAGFAFWSTQQYAQEQVQAERDRLLPQGGLAEVLVAARDLFAGEKLSAETLAVRQIPSQWLLPNSLSPADFDSVNQVMIAASLKAGHPLTLTHLQQLTAAKSSLKLEPGFRAISIPVDEVSSIGGLIQPGDRIDLWASIAPVATPDSGATLVSLPTERTSAVWPARLLAENLRVIATGQRTERSASGPLMNGAANRSDSAYTAYASLTLAVPAATAAAVLGGQSQGRISIALRSEQDQKAASKRSGKKFKTHTPPAPPPPVEILMGGIEGGTQ